MIITENFFKSEVQPIRNDQRMFSQSEAFIGRRQLIYSDKLTVSKAEQNGSCIDLGENIGVDSKLEIVGITSGPTHPYDVLLECNSTSNDESI